MSKNVRQSGDFYLFLPRVQHVSVDAIIVPDALHLGVHCLAGLDVDADDVAVHMFFLQGDDDVLDVKASVLGEDLGDDEERVGKGLDTHLCAALDGLFELDEVLGQGDVESATTGDDGLVLNGILDGTKAIAHGIVAHIDRVGIGALEQDGHAVRVLDVFDKGIFLLTQHLLVHVACKAKHLLRQIIHRVLRNATARKLQTLHVAALGATQSKNVVLGKNVQRQRVNALLVDHNKPILGKFASAHRVFEIDNLAQLVVNVLTLALHELLTLLRRRVEEATVDLTVEIKKVSRDPSICAFLLFFFLFIFTSFRIPSSHSE